MGGSLNHLYYCRNCEKIKKTKKAYEVNFVIRKQNKINLIEVKSSDSKSIKSLKLTKEIYDKTISNLFVLHDGEIKGVAKKQMMKKLFWE